MRRAVVIALAGLLVSPRAWAQPSADELRAVWRSNAAAIDEHAIIRVDFTHGEFDALAEGETLRRLVDDDDGLAAVGVIWVPCDPIQIWVAIQDIEDRPLNKGQMTITRLSSDTLTRRLTHNVVHTPWPIADRQSVAVVTANTELWSASDQQVWERTLALGDPKLVPDADPDAVWVLQLGGGFQVLDVGGGSLVIMEFRADPGGKLPAELSTRFSYLGLHRTMDTLSQFALEVPEHFGVNHKAVALPDGRLVEPGSITR